MTNDSAIYDLLCRNGMDTDISGGQFDALQREIASLVRAAVAAKCAEIARMRADLLASGREAWEFASELYVADPGPFPDGSRARRVLVIPVLHGADLSGARLDGAIGVPE